MKKHLIASIACTCLVMSLAVVGSSAKFVDIPEPPAIGATIEDFTLSDADGKERSLSSLKGKNGTVLIFMSVQCPVSNAYNERMEKLAKDYATRGINVIGINSNKTETGEGVKAHAEANHLTFPILKDPENKIADRLGATKTPEVYYLSPKNSLLYHGRIDNSRDATGISSNDLREALDETLAGKSVTKPLATAFGCTIKRV